VPQSRSYAFSDPYAMAAAVRGSSTELVLTSKGDFHGSITTIDLHRLLMLRATLTVPAIIRTAITSGRATIMFLADRQQGSFGYGNREMVPDEILSYGQDANDHFRSGANLRCAAMSLTPDDLVAAGEAIAGREIAVPSANRIVRPEPAAMCRLMVLHDAVGKLAEAAPEKLTNPAIATALERELVHAMVRCLIEPIAAGERGDTTRHARIIGRFEDYLASRRYEPIYLAEICAAIGVSERTLRSFCQEHLGVGPVRYLWLRRMNLAHRALLRAEAGKTSVTEIATAHGFWELGRFSVEYRALFDEAPSATLRRVPDEGGRQSVRHWVALSESA
jgi:AraC-like DNA-binding protein